MASQAENLLVSSGEEPLEADWAADEFLPSNPGEDPDPSSLVEEALDEGRSLRGMIVEGTTPLLFCCYLFDEDLAIRIVKEGRDADLHARTSGRRTALHFSAEFPLDELLPVLLEHAPDLTARTDDVCVVGGIYESGGKTPLHLAADKGNLGAVKLLLQASRSALIKGFPDLLPFEGGLGEEGKEGFENQSPEDAPGETVFSEAEKLAAAEDFLVPWTSDWDGNSPWLLALIAGKWQVAQILMDHCVSWDAARRALLQRYPQLESELVSSHHLSDNGKMADILKAEPGPEASPSEQKFQLLTLRDLGLVPEISLNLEIEEPPNGGPLAPNEDAGRIPPAAWFQKKRGQDIALSRLRAQARSQPPESMRAVHRFPGFWSKEESEQMGRAVLSHVFGRGGWKHSRHRAHSTTDLEAWRIDPKSYGFLRRSLEERAFPWIAQQYGLPLVQSRTDAQPRVPLGFRDLFFVIYRAAPGCQAELSLHRDGSLLSFNILLNPHAEFRGGGTFFPELGEVVGSEQGDLVVHSGQLLHAGQRITAGRRLILVGFLEVDDDLFPRQK